MGQIKIGDAAALLGVSDDTVRRWVEQGRRWPAEVPEWNAQPLHGRQGERARSLKRYALQPRHVATFTFVRIAEKSVSVFPT